VFAKVPLELVHPLAALEPTLPLFSVFVVVGETQLIPEY